MSTMENIREMYASRMSEQLNNSISRAIKNIKRVNQSMNMAATFNNQMIQPLAALTTVLESYQNALQTNQNIIKNIQNSLSIFSEKNYSIRNHISPNILASKWENAVLKNVSSIVEGYDITKSMDTVQNTLASLRQSSLNITDIINEAAEQYIQDNELDESSSIEIRELATMTANKKMLSERQRKVWKEYIWPIVYTVVSTIIASLILSILQPQSATNITEVNNYYINETGVDSTLLNNMNYRMVCKDDIKPRTKPNMSSKVVSTLHTGKIVNVISKHKKWIEIIWKNDDGEDCIGWIQNYNVAKFK
ncbi:SH3 domain-containing protein [[Clostridium] innocuum]|nr:SH3 domain-containing protein [[Clostridium] innocuum]MCR0369746.1 SH3 domain-containing protein [[Clostridium] innocuum]MCR0374743.1 SH3 domain-containing protein [[Clostridium] innocuum]MCR0559699.1 SH3 domain-containing protein [[Clostridium] innocuum]MCR0602607.1 SH3 domain-containing protein [[Clostridium] innocuum]